MAAPLSRKGCANVARSLLVIWSGLCLSGQAVAQDPGAAKAALSLAQPIARAVPGEPRVSVSGTYNGAEGSELASVSCNGKDGVVFGERFVVEDVPLKEGSNRLLIVAKDTAGRAVDATVEVTCGVLESCRSLKNGVHWGKIAS